MGIGGRGNPDRDHAERDGTALLATYDGLVQSDTSFCEWDYPDPTLTGVYVIDLQRDPSDPDGLYALVTDGAGPDPYPPEILLGHGETGVGLTVGLTVMSFGFRRIGAATETELKERKARVEDAMHATKAAAEEGIVHV